MTKADLHDTPSTNFSPLLNPSLRIFYRRSLRCRSIGSTLADKHAAPANGPLNWNELSSDLIVASHFSSTVGIYSLEGCIRQGFLPRLASFDWGQTVTISTDAMKLAQQFHRRVGLAIWIISRLPYFLAAALLLVLYLLYRLRLRRRKKKRLAQIAQGGQMT